MAIQRWDPLREMNEIQQRINRLFDEVFSRSTRSGDGESATASGWQPPTDLVEEPDRYLLRADLPGVVPADVAIRIEGGYLHVSGERKIDADGNGRAFLRVERPHGSFSLKIALAPSVDSRSVKATHRNGVVEIVLPKKAAEQPSRVEITTN